MSSSPARSIDFVIMKIKTGLQLSALFTIAIALVIGLFLGWATEREQEAVHKVGISDDIIRSVFNLSVVTNDYFKHHQASHLSEWQRGIGQLAEVLTQALSADPRQQEIIERLRHTNEELAAFFVETEALHREPTSEETDHRQVDQRLAGQLATRLHAMVSDATELDEASMAEIKMVVSRASIIIKWLIGVLIVGVTAISIAIGRGIIHPLGRLQEGIEVIAAGHLEHRVGTTAKDEIGRLGRAFDKMTRNLMSTMASRDQLNREVEQRKRAEVELKRLNERFELAVNSAQIGVWDWDVQADRLVWDERMYVLYGIKAADFSGTRAGWERLLHPDDAGRVVAEVRRALRAGAAFEAEFRVVRSEGRVCHLKAHARVGWDDEGAPLRLTGVSYDITERKEAMESLRTLSESLARSNQELEHFAYVTSHDLQEPLRMVSSYVQLLARRYRGKLDQDADEFIHYAVDGAERMQRMINDLLSYSRIGTRGEPFIPTDCEEILAFALDNLKLALEESGAQVTHDPLPTLNADGSQLTQLFQNLIGNAIKFRKPGEVPRIRIKASRRMMSDLESGAGALPSETAQPQEAKREGWLFGVSDNGIGIDPQDFARLFKIFQRLHSREKYPGTGIGLAVCQRIVERHGGRLWVESTLGNGATFYFTLPG